MIFSFASIFVVVFVSWKLCDFFLPTFQTWLEAGLSNTLIKILNEAIPGNFSNIADLQTAVSQSNYAILFNIVLFKILGNLSIDGEMTAGQILSPTLTTLLIKVITFIVIFVVLYISIKLVCSILNKMIKKCGLTFGNRIFGGLIGLAKGMIIFLILYFLLNALSNFLLNETLSNFVQNGVVSKWLYENLTEKIIDLFY